LEIVPGIRRAIEVTMAVEKRVLIIETSGRVGQVALASSRAIVTEARLGEGHRRASDLALVVDRLLKEQGWSPRELTSVIVGLGPGSYTGLRVGLASAKAMAYATGCAFFGVETFAAIAMQTPDTDVSVVGDALQGKLFRRDYRCNESGKREPVGPLEIVSATDWLASLRPNVVVTGPAAGMFEGRLPAGVRIANADRRDPCPIGLLDAVECPWAVTTDMWTAEPFYLRGSSAEEKAALSASAPGTAAAGR
jgi:tRNA threonylcarbamoyladenosine biosynthesis protein TsaB